ncbi:hypothetical protein H8958_017372 [Nasalis larvatus]
MLLNLGGLVSHSVGVPSYTVGAREPAGAQNGVNPDWEKKVIEYFKEKLKENNAPKWVPSLNEVPLHYLKPNSFVKFRCMIQDMFDPEFYMGVYETVNQNTKAHEFDVTFFNPPEIF